jgi:hypothetical protein
LDGVTRTIVWDVDDVLNDLMRSWLDRVWTPAHPGRNVKMEDVRANPPHALLGISHADYLSSLDGFRLSTGYAELAPNADILAWLREHGGRSRHVALTATALSAAPAASEWVLRNFGWWIREFAFIPAERAGQVPPAYDVDKGAWLSRIGPSAILVDDSPHNLAAATAANAVALCWPRPWNSSGASVAETLRALTQLLDIETS